MVNGSRHVGCRGWFALGLVLTAGLTEAGAAESPKPQAPGAARWVSAGALIYLEMPDPSALIDRLSDEGLQGKLVAIPSVKRAYDGDDYRKLVAVADVVAGKLGTTREKALRGLTGGGLVLAVEAPEHGKPRTFLVVTPTDPGILSKASAALNDLARQDAAAKGKADPLKEDDYRGTTVYAVGDAGYAVVDGRLVVADRAETVRVVIDRALDGLKNSVAADADWTARRTGATPGALAWAFARTDRLRELDPKRFGGGAGEKPPAGPTFLFGGWVEALRNAPWVSGSLTWTGGRLAADLTLPVGPKGRAEAFQGFFPPGGSGAPSLLNPPGTVASLSLWRDLSAVWEARADLFRAADVQNLAKLDTTAGQFFGGRDFGTGVLGSLDNDWRLVVALQDDAALKPAPDVKLPAFALVVDLKPDDEDFAQRLKVAFQSFIGLANLGAAQTKAPPLELGSETFRGVTLSTARFMAGKPTTGGETSSTSKAAVHYRHNFSPTVAQVGNHFLISSSVGLARDLVESLQSPTKAGHSTLVAEADGAALARLVDLNRNRMVMQNMLEKGHDRQQAEGEVGLLGSLLRYLGHARLSVVDRDDATRLNLDFTLGR